jgi:hypothetical protein
MYLYDKANTMLNDHLIKESDFIKAVASQHRKIKEALRQAKIEALIKSRNEKALQKARIRLTKLLQSQAVKKLKSGLKQYAKQQRETERLSIGIERDFQRAYKQELRAEKKYLIASTKAIHKEIRINVLESLLHVKQMVSSII